MGQFKPMVKMETTEPSVILKLKKGGHVAMDKDDNGHTNMKGKNFMKGGNEESCEDGASPKKPSMSDRRKAMSGAMLNSKKGGKAVKKADGGMMGAPMGGAPMGGAPMGAPMDPRKAAMMRAMRMRKPPMGGAPMAAPMAAPAAPMGAPGMPAMKKGGKAGDKAQDKAMMAKAFKQHDAQEHKGGKGTKLKLATGGLTNPMKKGGKVSGAAIDTAMDKTTVKGNEGAFADTKMYSKKTNPGYERYAAGGTVEGNEGAFAKTKMERKKTNPGYERYATGGVVNGMATGGLTNPMKKGGAAKKHYATGGSVSTGHAVAMPKKPVSKPVSNTNQSGTFKKGGRVDSELVDASKGAYDKSIGPSGDDMEMAKSFRDPVGSMKKLLGMGPDPTEKQVIHTGGYKKGGNAKC